MNKTVGFISGVTTGLLVGAAVTMLMDPITDRQRHKLQKKTEGVFRSNALKNTKKHRICGSHTATVFFHIGLTFPGAQSGIFRRFLKAPVFW